MIKISSHLFISNVVKTQPKLSTLVLRASYGWFGQLVYSRFNPFLRLVNRRSIDVRKLLARR